MTMMASSAEKNSAENNSITTPFLSLIN